MYSQQVNTTSPQAQSQAMIGMGPSAQRTPTPGDPTQGAQTQQLAQQLAQQQIEQAKQAFQSAAQGVVQLGDQFPDMKNQFDQLGAAVMQLASQAIATLQPQPIAPAVG